MIDFLNLSEDKNKCRDCLKIGHSLHLIPYEFNPYVFYTGYDEYFTEEVYILDSYGNEILIFLDYDENTRAYVSIGNIQFDDVNNVVLKFVLRHDDTYANDVKILYSDPLKISSKDSCKTTRVHFKCKDNDILLNASFPFWKWHDKRNVELETYYQISTKSQVSYTKSNVKYSKYQTDFMNIETINKLSDALSLPYVYFDYKRVSLVEPIEIPDLTADEYFAETSIFVTEYKGIDSDELDSSVYLIDEQGNNIVTENNDNIILE